MAAHRNNRIKLVWTSNFAYVIGVIATDGNLSSDLRHILVTSKDYEMVLNCKKCLGIENKIGRKARGGEKEKKYYVLQFGETNFFEFLLKIGITPRKSKTISELKIPFQYFPDFFRGCMDGDGSISIFNHPESKHKQLKVRLYSASLPFLTWIHNTIVLILKIKGGHIYKDPIKEVYGLSYAKSDGGKILSFMYYKRDLPCLHRKRRLALKIIGRVA